MTVMVKHILGSSDIIHLSVVQYGSDLHDHCQRSKCSSNEIPTSCSKALARLVVVDLFKLTLYY